jgi:hypothetical protein
MSWQIPPEQLRQALSSVPMPIREFIVEGELTELSLKIAQQYQLHVDSTGQLVQLMTSVLLGFLSPTLLPGELQKIGIPENLVTQFVNDINVQIFVPLQKRVKEKGTEMTKEERIEAGKSFLPETAVLESEPPSYRTTSPAPTVPVPGVAAPVQTSMPEIVRDTVTPSFNLVGNTAGSAPVTTTPFASVPVTAPAPTFRTMQHDVEALQHGVAPTPYPSSYPSTMNAPHPSQMTPAREFQTASVPFTSIPALSRPVEQSSARVSAPISVPRQTPDVVSPPTPILKPQSAPPIVSSGGDPYRESI